MPSNLARLAQRSGYNELSILKVALEKERVARLLGGHKSMTLNKIDGIVRVNEPATVGG